MALTTYSALVAGFNSAVPVALQLPEVAKNEVTIRTQSAEMTVNLVDAQVTKITVTAFGADVHGDYYKLFVDGLEGGMGWSSANFYHAAMATLADHEEHTGVNAAGITAVHTFVAGDLVVVLTKD